VFVHKVFTAIEKLTENLDNLSQLLATFLPNWMGQIDVTKRELTFHIYSEFPHGVLEIPYIIQRAEPRNYEQNTPRILLQLVYHSSSILSLLSAIDSPVNKNPSIALATPVEFKKNLVFPQLRPCNGHLGLFKTHLAMSVGSEVIMLGVKLNVAILPIPN
jgi:hypothetical protein